MMKAHLMIMFLILIVCVRVNGQSYIAPRYLEVSVSQTTNLVLPSAILSVDRGSERIVVQKSTANILRVKAESQFSDTTNLTIITTDGKLYSFLVHYVKYPANLNINLSGELLNSDTSYTALVRRVAQLKNNLFGIGVKTSGVHLSLLGLYSTGEEVICKIKIENNSSLSYAFGSMRFYSSERRTAKRRSSQDREVLPVHLPHNNLVIRENSFLLFTVILAKPSLVSVRRLVIDVFEKDGDRNLSLSIANRYLLKSLSLTR